jgi:hypothetical protein
MEMMAMTTKSSIKVNALRGMEHFSLERTDKLPDHVMKQSLCLGQIFSLPLHMPSSIRLS